MRSWGGFVWIGNGGIAHDNLEVRLFRVILLLKAIMVNIFYVV